MALNDLPQIDDSSENDNLAKSYFTSLLNQKAGYISREQTPDKGTFYFTNYTFDPQSAWGHTYTDTDAMAYFSVATKDKKAVANGVWDASKKDDNNKLSDTSISSKKTSRGLIGDKKKVEITYFGSDYVCGDVSIDDGYGSITGKFIAKYHKWTSSL